MGRGDDLMPEWHELWTAETRQLEQALRPHFQRVDAYRSTPSTIRARVVDPRFAGKSYHEREKLVLPFLSRLPTDLQLDVTMLVLVTPEEEPEDLINAEF